MRDVKGEGEVEYIGFLGGGIELVFLYLWGVFCYSWIGLVFGFVFFWVIVVVLKNNIIGVCFVSFLCLVMEVWWNKLMVGDSVVIGLRGDGVGLMGFFVFFVVFLWDLKIRLGRGFWGIIVYYCILLYIIVFLNWCVDIIRW